MSQWISLHGMSGIMWFYAGIGAGLVIAWLVALLVLMDAE